MQKSNRRFEKVITVLIALAIFAIGIRIGLSQSGNFLKSVVEPGSMTTEASYIIFTDGTTVYARNGTTGEIQFSSTSASAVISNAIGNMTNGNIFIKSGNYSITRLTTNKTSTTLTDRFPLWISGGKQISISGEAGTVLRVANGENVGLWYIAANASVSLSNMELDGNYAGQTFDSFPADSQDLYCIYSYGGRFTNVTLTNIYAHDAVTDNVALVGANHDGGYYWVQGLTTKHAQYDALIISQGAQVYIDGYVANGFIELRHVGTSLHLTNAMMTGIAVNDPVISIVQGGVSLYLSNFEINTGRISCAGDSNTSYVNIENGRINGDIVLYNATGKIALVNQTASNIVSGLTLYGCSGLQVSSCNFQNDFYGAHLRSSGVPSAHNSFIGNSFSNNDAGGYHEDDASQDYNTLTGNDFTGQSTNPVSAFGPHDLFNGNPGYLTGLGADASSASYIIYTDGTTYYAKNGTTGMVDYYGTNASSIIQNAINALTSGGNIFITAGTYPITNISITNSGVTLSGAGNSTKLLKIDNSPAMINVNDQFFTMRDMELWGNYSGSLVGRGLYIHNSIYVTLQNIFIQKFYGIGLYVDSSDIVFVQNVYSDDSGINPAQTESAMVYVSVTDLFLTNVGAGGSKRAGIELSDCANCYLTNVRTYLNGLYGFYVYYPSGLIAVTNIESNDNYDNYELNQAGAVGHISIIGGNSDSPTNLAVDGYNSTYQHLGIAGFTTENSGTATVSNNDWVAHGLATTPTIVTLTPSAYNVTAYVLSSNSTHIQIGLYYTTTGTNVTSPAMIYWHAEV